MVTCFLRYVIDPTKVDAFEHYGKLWIDLVNKMGGLHHGYLIPHEGPNNIGYARESKCILSLERNFYKPVFEGIEEKAKLFY